MTKQGFIMMFTKMFTKIHTKSKSFLLLVISLLLLTALSCQGDGDFRQNKALKPDAMNKTEWFLPDYTEFYRFITEDSYTYCTFNMGIVVDEGKYTVEGNVVTFDSSLKKISWTAVVKGDTLTTDTGRVYIRQ